LAWTPPACRSAASRYSELNPVVACDQAATPFLDFRAPSRRLPFSLPPGTLRIRLARTKPHRTVSQQPTSVRCLSAHKGARYPNGEVCHPSPEPARRFYTLGEPCHEPHIRRRRIGPSLTPDRVSFTPAALIGFTPTGSCSPWRSEARFHDSFLPCRFGPYSDGSIGFGGLIPPRSGSRPPKRPSPTLLAFLPSEALPPAVTQTGFPASSPHVLPSTSRSLHTGTTGF